MPFVELSEVTLFYTDEGQGESTVLLLHGWTCDGHDWSWQIPALTRVIVPDLGGHGRSSEPATGYSPHAYALDVAEMIVTLGLRTVVVVGHSLDAAIASVLAVQHADLVSALVVVDPAYGIEPSRAADARESANALSGQGIHRKVADRLAGLEGQTISPGLSNWHRRRVFGVPGHLIAESAQQGHLAPDSIAFRSNTDDHVRARSMLTLAVHRGPARAYWEGAG